MKIAVLGIRGFPNVQGGVEVHCQNLYPHLVEKGCQVIVFTRRPYVNLAITNYKGIQLIPLACPKSKFLEAFAHTFLGVFTAKKINPNIMHIHAIGPSIMVLLMRILGFKVIMTHHGPDYQRKKWNKFAKIILRLGEKIGVKYACQIITISKSIANDIKDKYKREAFVIPNGVIIPQILKTQEALKAYGLEKGKYILAVGRFVPEKGFHDLIEAFVRLQGEVRRAKAEEWKLAIVGEADHEDRYSREFKKKATENPDVVLTGRLTGQPLAELYSHAGLFVLPSYYEGLPIVLLEAMSYGLSCIVSDIPANREVSLPEDRFFKTGNVQQLAEKIIEFISKPLSVEEKTRQVSLISEKYDWGRIAQQTLEVYRLVSGF
jgi:glycosyltransferase involved in cell wall biosynthesis